MLTGDAIAIAKETCKMLSLGTKVYNANKLFNSGLSGTLQHDLIDRADGFAEVFPEHKYQVVEMLQQRGSLTAMTGDGKSSRLLQTSNIGHPKGGENLANTATSFKFVPQKMLI